MSTDPRTFLSQTLPTLFAKGVASLRDKAAAGDALAQKRLDDCTAVEGAAIVVLDDDAPLYLAASGGTLTFSESKPSAPIQMALGCAAEAIEVALGEAAKENALDDPRVVEAAPALASKRLEQLLNGRKISCHLFVKDHPDLGDVTVRFGFNIDAPPEKPAFTAELKHEDLEALRAGTMDFQKLFMGGKLRLKGDYSVALQVAMQLAQEAQAAMKKR